MRRPVVLSDRARGYGLWPGDVLARLPGARITGLSYRYDPRPSLVVAVAMPGDTSPVPEVPVTVELTFGGARVRAWRPRWRDLLPRRTSDELPEIVELALARFGPFGRFRLLHSAGRLVVRADDLWVDVVAGAELRAVPDALAS